MHGFRFFYAAVRTTFVPVTALAFLVTGFKSNHYRTRALPLDGVV